LPHFATVFRRPAKEKGKRGKNAHTILLKKKIQTRRFVKNRLKNTRSFPYKTRQV